MLKLTPGSRVLLCSTARFVDASVIQKFQTFCSQNQWEAVIDGHVDQAWNQFAGDDTARQKSFQAALNRSDVDALFFARGGYGSVRIMESLDFSGLKKHPKWIIGFSDACYLLNPIAEVLPTLHGPMAIQLETDAMTDTLLAQFLTGKHYTWNCTVEQAASFHCDDAVLIGGNLSIVYAMLATPFWKVPSGAILFLEDLDEYLYHIDRMMASLYFSGTLTKVQAVLAGSFSDMKDHTTPIGWTASECLQHWCNKANTPLIEGLPFGHKKENYPLILGQPCSISVKNEQFSIRWA